MSRVDRGDRANGTVLVTGGTGTLGRLVVRRLREKARRIRVLSRRSYEAANGTEFVTGDLLKGDGLEGALSDVSTIVHCASSNKGDADATRNLVHAASTLPRPPHLVFISIVGADRVSFGYIRSKLEAERVVADSGLPWTTLRATQFYDLILAGAVKVAKLPVVPIPAGIRVQPVDPDEVAARLVELALSQPAGRVPDLGGPQIANAADLIRAYLRAIDRRRPVAELWVPGTRALRTGGLLVQEPAHDQGARTWEEFLADRLDEQAG